MSQFDQIFPKYLCIIKAANIGLVSGRQVLRLTWKVRRENEPLKTVKLNFTGSFCGKVSFRTPCWAHSWIRTHINWDFLMAGRIFIHNSRRNHFQSIFPQFGTQFVTRISHFGNMDFSYSDFEFLHSSTQQVIEEGLVFFLVYLEVEEAKYKNTNIQIHKYKNTVWVSQF